MKLFYLFRKCYSMINLIFDLYIHTSICGSKREQMNYFTLETNMLK